MEFLLHVVVTAGLLLLVAHWVKGFEIQSGKIALWSALVLGLVNGLVRPVLFFLTLGLFLIVINAAMLKLAAGIVKGFNIRGLRSGPTWQRTVELVEPGGVGGVWQRAVGRQNTEYPISNFNGRYWILDIPYIDCPRAFRPGFFSNLFGGR